MVFVLKDHVEELQIVGRFDVEVEEESLHVVGDGQRSHEAEKGLGNVEVQGYVEEKIFDYFLEFLRKVGESENVGEEHSVGFEFFADEVIGEVFLDGVQEDDELRDSDFLLDRELVDQLQKNQLVFGGEQQLNDQEQETLRLLRVEDLLHELGDEFLGPLLYLQPPDLALESEMQVLRGNSVDFLLELRPLINQVLNSLIHAFLENLAQEKQDWFLAHQEDLLINQD